MAELVPFFAENGDIAHMALFLWAASASAVAAFTLKELSRSHTRYEDFVDEIRRATRQLGS